MPIQPRTTSYIEQAQIVPCTVATAGDRLWHDVGHSMGHGGALVESIAFSRRVAGSTPALAAI